MVLLKLLSVSLNKMRGCSIYFWPKMVLLFFKVFSSMIYAHALKPTCRTLFPICNGEYCTIKVGDCLIQSRTHIKYLGIIIDRRLTYKEHLIYVSEKTSQAASSLARIMANKRGLRQTGRKLLATVAASMHLYGSKQH